MLASLHLWCWKRKWNSRFSCTRSAALKSPPVVEKCSRAVRSGAGFLSESQAGCRICSCSLAWQRANSNTAALICFSVSRTFVCHFPIRHHTSLNQRLKFPQLSMQWWHELLSCSVPFSVTQLTLGSKWGPQLSSYSVTCPIPASLGLCTPLVRHV